MRLFAVLLLIILVGGCPGKDGNKRDAKVSLQNQNRSGTLGIVGVQPVLRTGDRPIGSLGFPIGDYLTLEGKRAHGIKTGTQTLLVDAVNGKRLDSPVGIWIDNVDLPPEFRCRLNGYETIRTLGVPPAVEQAAKETGKDICLPQAGWQIQLYFVALCNVVLKDATLVNDPPAAIQSVLPAHWSILKVEDNAYPPNRPKGNGKAIVLGCHSTVDVVLYIMPGDYRDGGTIPQPGQPRTTNPATLVATTSTAKIYLWEKFGQFSASGWPSLTDDVIKALLKPANDPSRQ